MLTQQADDNTHQLMTADPASAPLPDLALNTSGSALDELAAETPEPSNDAASIPAEPLPPLPPAEPLPEPSKLLATTPTDTSLEVDLDDIKNDALGDLRPLVDRLDETPEAKFKTIMMMIQASDDQSLLKKAYDCTKQITDEKARSEALLDVINEVNYFSHK